MNFFFSKPTSNETKVVDGFDVRRYSPMNLADELTLINQQLLLRIHPKEFSDFRYLSVQKEKFAPNITLMFEFYDRIVAVFATQILKQKTDKSRASVIIHLFAVGESLSVTSEIIKFS